MTTRVRLEAVGGQLADYLQRAGERGERFLVERDGQPVAAVVSVEDLQRLEALDAGDLSQDPAEIAFRHAMEEEGLIVDWPSGPPVPLEDRHPIEIEGRPISEDIIADRR